jgi:hypothetical protein
VVTLTGPMTTTLRLENNLALLTIPTIQLYIAAPQPDIKLLPKQHQAYQEGQQV